MTRSYCLSYLTLEISPPETITIAAGAGYDSFGNRMMPALPGGRAFPLMDDDRLMRETSRRLEDTGLSIFDVEIARIHEHTNVEAWLPMLEAAGRLRAKTIIAAGLDPDEARMTDTFASLCEAAEPFGLTINLEFTPWAPSNNAAAATRVVTAADRPNGQNPDRHDPCRALEHHAGRSPCDPGRADESFPDLRLPVGTARDAR